MTDVHAVLLSKQLVALRLGGAQVRQLRTSFATSE
jgi:hypothetical protein